MEQRLEQLAGIFAINILAYAIMSNHYHVVVQIDAARASAWSDEEVVNRWRKIFAVPDSMSPRDLDCWRDRLFSLSWFMRCLNEPLARLANREDGCKGRFWEGRFNCQALLDEAALLKCMVYVDLNPIRAAIARTPETSSHTSIKARVERRDAHLAPFLTDAHNNIFFIPIRKHEYLALVDWTGRQLRTKKRGRIPEHLPPIMRRIGIDTGNWIAEIGHYGKWYFRAVGSIQALEQYCKHLGQRWLKGKLKAAHQGV